MYFIKWTKVKNESCSVFYLLTWFTCMCFLNIIMLSLVLVPSATVTNHHWVSGLKQQKLIIPQFWRWEVQDESHWTTIEMSAGCVPSWTAMKESISFPLPASRGSPHLLLGNPFQAVIPLLWPLLALPHLLLTWTFLHPSLSWDYIGPTHIVQDSLPFWRSLT